MARKKKKPATVEAVVVSQDDFGFWCGKCNARNNLPFSVTRAKYQGMSTQCEECGAVHFVDNQIVLCEV